MYIFAKTQKVYYLEQHYGYSETRPVCTLKAAGPTSLSSLTGCRSEGRSECPPGANGRAPLALLLRACPPPWWGLAPLDLVPGERS